MPRKPQTAVLMSGGVDSSVAALLLRRAGHHVVGISLLMHENQAACQCAGEIARRIGIPHQTLDVRQSFNKKVIDYMIHEYLQGRTPNPCAVCNSAIKLSETLSHIAASKLDKVATGHYARIEYRQGCFHLLKGRAGAKSQEYFLARLTQQQLAHLQLPLGELQKKDVVEIARQEGLKSLTAKESQQLCFVHQADYTQFIQNQLKQHTLKADGDIVNRKGERLGSHRCYFGFTIGQRRGLGISSSRSLYVLEINAQSRQVVVGEEEHLYQNEFFADEPNWISEEHPKAARELQLKVRYRQPAVPATVYPEPGRLRICVREPIRTITPGQLAVFYEGEEVVGSAWIMTHPTKDTQHR